MIAVVQTVALAGYDGALVEVETDARAGLPGVQIVGMGNKAVDEARERVRSAIRHSLLEFPAKKVTINLAPAELPKHGAHFDLPIALSILVSTGQLKQSEVTGKVFAGELSLDGRLRPIRGAIGIAEVARTAGFKEVYLPIENVSQAKLVSDIDIIGVPHLKELFRHLRGFQELQETVSTSETTSAPSFLSLDDIRGHARAKRALMIAVAGRHNILLSGPPGAGKTLLARALGGLLPPLSSEEALEATKLHGLEHGESGQIVTYPPFRSPHHSTTLASLVGGGVRALPGEISLAHRGVLFLDELPEYSRQALEALRQPLEDRTISVSRTQGRFTYPADVLMVATMNPCPCGYAGDTAMRCRCTNAQIASYRNRLSGPLLDRIDLRLTVEKVDIEHIVESNTSQLQQHSKVLKFIQSARELQHKRFNRRDLYNAHASPSVVQKTFKIDPSAQTFSMAAAKKLALSTRAYYRVLRIARTIADLAQSKNVLVEHVAEALQYRGQEMIDAEA